MWCGVESCHVCVCHVYVYIMKDDSHNYDNDRMHHSHLGSYAYTLPDWAHVFLFDTDTIMKRKEHFICVLQAHEVFVRPAFIWMQPKRAPSAHL